MKPNAEVKYSIYYTDPKIEDTEMLVQINRQSE